MIMGITAVTRAKTSDDGVLKPTVNTCSIRVPAASHDSDELGYLACGSSNEVFHLGRACGEVVDLSLAFMPAARSSMPLLWL